MCIRRWDELKFCVKLKGASDDEARGMLRSLVADQRTTLGVVWQERPRGPAAPDGGNTPTK